MEEPNKINTEYRFKDENGEWDSLSDLDTILAKIFEDQCNSEDKYKSEKMRLIPNIN